MRGKIIKARGLGTEHVKNVIILGKVEDRILRVFDVFWCLLDMQKRKCVYDNHRKMWWYL